MNQAVSSLVATQDDPETTEVLVTQGNYYKNLFSEDCNKNLFSKVYGTTNSELADKIAEASDMG